ncbi:MAG TPA: FeoA family protein [Selenomonadales bacterium]|nr:FeoA family protein [Selenomonadales bacterium]
MYVPEQRSSLADLKVGTTGKISSIELDGLLRRRILDLGILPGTQVQCVRKSPAGDPIAFRVRDTTIALRSDDASLIKVYPG